MLYSVRVRLMMMLIMMMTVMVMIFLCLTNDQCYPISVFVAVMLEFLCFVWVLGAVYLDLK